MIKMVFCVRRRSDLPEEEFYKYWLQKHGPLVKSQTSALKIRRYVQSHTALDDLGATVREGRGMKLPDFDGLAEVWWDSYQDLMSALESQEGQKASVLLAEDEARFIDMEASTIFFTEEHVVVDS
ncbi:MAG: EthD domain-containing protein [Halioglobus sp.]|jgi:uncharacterized protein (TIGR02118 family)